MGSYANVIEFLAKQKLFGMFDICLKRKCLNIPIYQNKVYMMCVMRLTTSSFTGKSFSEALFIKSVFKFLVKIKASQIFAISALEGKTLDR